MRVLLHRRPAAEAVPARIVVDYQTLKLESAFSKDLLEYIQSHDPLAG